MKKSVWDETTIPKVLPEYLIAGSLLDQGFLKIGANREHEESEKSVSDSLVGCWQLGRSHCELLVYRDRFSGLGICDGEIAALLDVTTAAVGQWWNGRRAIRAKHMSSLKCAYEAELRHCKLPSTHEQSLAGFRCAISRADNPRRQVKDFISIPDFWILWFMLRNRQWHCAQETKNSELLSGAATNIYDDASFVCGETITSSRIHDRDSLVSHLQSLESAWGPSFVLTIECVKAFRWAPPEPKNVSKP